MIVVQGDTTTTFSAALAGFYAGIPVSHVEAGLRTFDFHAPFPEEMNRTFTTRLADLHFAPTAQAAENLHREGISPDRVEVTGNTGIDAVLAIRDGLERGDLTGMNVPLQPGKKLIVVTSHRRESFGEGFFEITEAVCDLSARGDVEIVWPVHPNPQITNVIESRLQNEPNIRLLQPLEYVSFVDLMRRAYLILTDSGGIQEEAPSLGKPVLVLREKTERPEAVEAGTVKLVGRDRRAILRETVRLLEDRAEYDRMARTHNPYGDGHASARIARRIQEYLR